MASSEGAGSMTKKGKLIWFKVYPAQLMQHFTHSLDYDIITMGIKTVLWSCAAAEKPTGTLPDDIKKWARWTGLDVKTIKEKKALITSSWFLNSSGRWEIQRIIDAANETRSRSESAAIGAKKRWSESNCRNANAYANAMQTDMQSQCHLKVKVKDRVKVKDKDRKEQNKESQNRSDQPETVNDQKSCFGLSATPSPKELEIRSAAKAMKAEIQEVYEYYLQKSNKSPGDYQLTTTRKDKIRTRLRKFTVAAIKAMIDECFVSEFHGGRNDRGEIYRDLGRHILHNHEKAEGWLNKAKARG